MEIKQLESFVLLLVMLGLIIGVGVLTLDKFGVATKDSTIVYSENVTITAGVGTPTNDDITSLDDCYDSSNRSHLILNSECNLSGTTEILVNTTGNGIIGINYTYDKDSTATTTVTSVNTSMGTIASTWLPLIVTIVVLSIILTLVIRSFVVKR